MYIGIGLSIGQGLKVVVGASFSKTERGAWTGEAGEWGGGAGLGRAGSNLRGTITTVKPEPMSFHRRL